MGRKCSVENCASDSTKPEHTGVTFHKVPYHSDVRPKWLSLCHIPDEKNSTKLLYICSRHFLRADFCSFKGKKYMLRQGVLPSVFPWDKSRLEAIKAEVNKKDADLYKKKDTNKNVKKTEVDKNSLESEKNTQNRDYLKSHELKVEPVEPLNLKNITVKELKEDLDPFDQHQRSQGTSSCNSINFAINSGIEVLDNNNIWYPAKINEVDYEENEVLIHFEKFSNKYDEWISMTSPRLRPLQPTAFERYEVGERCLAIWCDSRKFPATVTKVFENDTYEVLFDDDFVKVVKNYKLSKLNATKPSPLFDPVKGTKQERRDKKRKLDVAALFRKRPRVTEADEKKNKICSNSMDLSKDDLPVSQEEEPIPRSLLPQRHSVWENGRPLGEESTVETGDSSRKPVIVRDPRLPTGWVKHIFQTADGNSANKWDIIIVTPEGNQFRSRTEVKTYLELHPELDIDNNIFDFNISRKKKQSKSRQKRYLDNQSTEHLIVPPLVEESDFKEGIIEEPPVSLKIIFENDTYKCPIEGCGKNFRRENLALMHVKHYHSEFTKYLDSTPNVADLAYARTVGENLDRSPGLSKCTTKSAVDKTLGLTRTSKVTSSSHIVPKIEEYPMLEHKSKDTEIIKLLSEKPADSTTDIQPLPSGLPSSMYPDIKLKDLLGKTSELHMRDNINIKNLCTSRPFHGIKTLLPIRTNQPSLNDSNDENPGLRCNISSGRKELPKGEYSHHLGPLSVSQHQQNHQLQQSPPQTEIHLSSPSLGDLSQNNQQSQIETGAINTSVPLAFDLTPFAGLDNVRASTTAQLDGVIIEGGKIIKLERMKQEEIINCTCGFIEEDGLMIQCELCLCWQHAYCNNIQKENEVPEKYICFICQHPIRERRSSKYLHDQEWLKQGTLPVAFHYGKSDDLVVHFQKLKKLNDLSGATRELKEYLYTLATQLKVAEAKNHPKLYLWSRPWEKLDLPQHLGSKNGESVVIRPKFQAISHHYNKIDVGPIKHETRNDSMLLMILKSDKEDIPMLNMQSTTAPIIPQPEAAIDSNDCRLNLLEHIAHAESLIEDRLDNFEKQLDVLEKSINSEADHYPMIKQTLQLLLRDLNTLEKFGELPLV